MPCAHFEKPAERQEEHEHRRRIEPDGRPVGQRGIDRREVGAANGNRDRQVHARVARHDAPPGSVEKGSRGVEDDGCRHHEADDPQETLHFQIDPLEVTGVQTDGEHHDLHHAKRRHEQTLQGHALFGEFRPCRILRRQGLRLVAEIRQRREQFRETHVARSPAHSQPVRNRVDLGRLDARQLCQRRLDQPAAGCAIHPADVQRGFGRILASLGKRAEHVVAVENLPIGRVLGRASLPGSGRLAQRVVVAQSCVSNQFGNRLAAGTANRSRAAVHVDGEMTVSRDRQGAVKTGVSARHRYRQRLSATVFAAGHATPTTAASRHLI